MLILCVAHGQYEKPLTRDAISVFKKKLDAVFESLGQSPALYAQELRQKAGQLSLQAEELREEPITV
jgi:hypothetical protein